MTRRNDLCPCGSRKKYKRCCGIKNNTNDFDIWKSNALEILAVHPQKNVIIETLFATFEHSIAKNWSGACHALSSILYVLLREQEIDVELFLGAVDNNGFMFSHSWIEIDDEVYDIALYRSNDPRNIGSILTISPPIVKTLDITSKRKTNIKHGVEWPELRTNPNAQTIKTLTLGKYMSGWPSHRFGLWGEAEDIAKRINLKVNRKVMQEKFSKCKWKQK
ncbi:hypothetical protein AM501_05250 [Aneurinibacillus migulanus]|uniref:YecA family protein n=1 Tax=Aneurinibacillus migulanus TaxID=47500 RepID=UPI0005BD30F0|nr:SEC-C domain-containing protein [Aneurinibacillus migulanus]KIV58585.1 hypothetical protein TS64_04365 [Aneurinibacillus migulanus]KPD09243.1 hypothetical protein AM501_05250 [Aneurinibacillus migulanus]